jgi:hypothetical protein
VGGSCSRSGEGAKQSPLARRAPPTPTPPLKGEGLSSTPTHPYAATAIFSRPTSELVLVPTIST